MEDAKNTKLVKFEDKKFHSLTSYNSDYNTHFLFNKKFLTNKEYYKLFTDITTNDVKTYFETFKQDILTKGILFYYSKKNLNSNVDKYLKKSIIKNKYKMLYI